MKREIFMIVFFLCAALAAPAATISFETTERQLQSAIDRASEQGHFAEVSALRLELARQATAKGFYFDAERQYELLLAARPSKKERVRLFTELGRLREATGDYAGAIQAYEDALHDDPHAWTANLRSASVYTHEGMYGQGEQAYLKCLKLRPQDLSARDGLGDLYKDRGFLKQAIAVYQETLKHRPTAASFSGLAECYWRANDFAHAIETLQQAKASGVAGDYDTPLGFVYRRQGDFAQAAGVWEKALALHPERADLKLDLVWVDVPLGRVKDAEHLVEELLAAYPHSPLVHFTQAWLKLRQGHPEAAMAEARNVDELSPTDLVKHYNERLTQGIQK